MRRFFPALAISAGVTFLVAGGAIAQVELLGRENLPVETLGTPTLARLGLHLTVVRLEGAGWTRERAITIVREAAGILAQCRVALERAQLETLAAPAYLDFSTPAARALVRSHPVARPAVYLVRDTRSRPAFDAEAIGRGNSRTRPELADTVWLTAATRDPGIALAHELTHVLMDSGEHSDERGNLMRGETAPANRVLSSAQCARLRETGRENGLLRGDVRPQPSSGKSMNRTRSPRP